MNDQDQITSRKIHWVWKPLLTALVLGLLVQAGVCVYWSEGTETWKRILTFDHRFTLLAFGLIFIAWICNGMRLKILAGNLGYPISLVRTTQVTLAAEFGVAATPAGTGSLVFRVFLMRQLGVPPGVTLSLLAVDGIFDALFFILILPFAFKSIFSGNLTLSFDVSRWILIFFVLVLFIGLPIILFRRSDRKLDRLSKKSFLDLPQWRRRFRARRRLLRHRLTHSVKEFWEGLRTIAKIRKTTLILVLGIVAIQWSCRYGVLPLILWGFGHPVNPFLFFVLQGALFMLQLVLVVPGGSGGIEVTYALVMTQFISPELIAITLILWRFFTYYLYIIGGGTVFATLPYAFPKKRINEE